MNKKPDNIKNNYNLFSHRSCGIYFFLANPDVKDQKKVYKSLKKWLMVTTPNTDV